MEKDSAKLRVSQIIKSYFRATHIENSDYQGELVVADVNNIIDKIDPDNHKVKLPRKVGEELDQFAARYADVLQFAYHLYALSETEFPALVNWMCSAERRWVIIDAYRYGWEAEPEAKWYVKAPDSWKADGGGLNWHSGYLDKGGHGMTWYIVTKDDPGHIKRIGEEADRATTSKQHAEQLVKTYGGHVVELGEEPAPIVVSEDEDKVLKKAKNTTVWRPASVIARYAVEHERQADDEVLLEDRLMRAYVNGWVVKHPKRWYVTVPHVKNAWYFINNAGNLSATYVQNSAGKFTDAEIEHYGLQDCERVEVTDDEQ